MAPCRRAVARCLPGTKMFNPFFALLSNANTTESMQQLEGQENGVVKRQNGNRGSALRQIAAATGGPRDCCLEAVVSKRLPGVAPSFFFLRVRPSSSRGLAGEAPILQGGLVKPCSQYRVTAVCCGLRVLRACAGSGAHVPMKSRPHTSWRLDVRFVEWSSIV